MSKKEMGEYKEAPQANNNQNNFVPRTHYTQNPSMEHQRNLSTIFTADDDGRMVGPNYRDLAQAFAEARYRYDPNQNSLIRYVGPTVTSVQTGNQNPDYLGNTGAVQLFNIDNRHLTRPFSSTSTQIFSLPEKRQRRQLTNYGHSEKIGMRDVLDSFINSNNHSSFLLPPSGNVKSPNSQPIDQQREILQDLVNRASSYKDYLQNQNAVVKMWSERPPCGDRNSGCSKFINDIFPQGSQYGYISPNTNIKVSSEALRDAYLAYMRQQQPQSSSLLSSSSSSSNPVVSAISTSYPTSTYAAQQNPNHPFTVNPRSNTSLSSLNSQSLSASIRNHPVLAELTAEDFNYARNPEDAATAYARRLVAAYNNIPNDLSPRTRNSRINAIFTNQI